MAAACRSAVSLRVAVAVLCRVCAVGGARGHINSHYGLGSVLSSRQTRCGDPGALAHGICAQRVIFSHCGTGVQCLEGNTDVLGSTMNCI